jgi:arabinose-5-phosphate isomerase
MDPSEKLRSILAVEAASIVRASERVDAEAANRAVALLTSATGKAVVTGVGKSGVIARKIAQTLTSTGTPAIYLDALDALHGGLGLVRSGDVFIALSNSGETEELLAILPSLKKRSVAIISIVGNTRSSLAAASDVVLDGSVDREACPLNLAPTASTTVALAIGDALAMTVMEQKGLTQEDFAANHPAGRLGKRLTLCVRDLMHPSPNISPSDGWLTVVKAISDHALGAVNVVDDRGILIGIVTDGDLRRTIQRTPPTELSNLTASEMMTSSPTTVMSDVLAFEALTMMENRSSQISVLPVVDGSNAAIGLLRIHDIVKSGL